MNKRRIPRRARERAGRGYCVQVYSYAAVLVREYYLDAGEHDLPDI